MIHLLVVKLILYGLILVFYNFLSCWSDMTTCVTCFVKIYHITWNKQLSYGKKIGNNFIVNKSSKLKRYVSTTLVLPLNKVSEHLVVSTLHTSSFKQPWFFVKLEK